MQYAGRPASEVHCAPTVAWIPRHCRCRRDGRTSDVDIVGEQRDRCRISGAIAAAVLEVVGVFSMVAGVPVPAAFVSTRRRMPDGFTPRCPASRMVLVGTADVVAPVSARWRPTATPRS